MSEYCLGEYDVVVIGAGPAGLFCAGNIAKQGNMDKDDVGKIYDLLEEKIFNLLSSTNDEHDVEIRLFNGISLDGVYVPEKSKKNNST